MGIKLFGKNILQVYTHHIMKIDYETAQESAVSSFQLRKINDNDLASELENVGTTVTVSNLKRLISANGSLCEGFIFCEPDGTKAGTIWVMYKGGDDLEYRIRNTEAYIFDVYVKESCRGKGYAGMMIRLLMEYLHQKGISSAVLAVSVKNKSAIRAYEKTGFQTVDTLTFMRLLKVNIPYHTL